MEELLIVIIQYLFEFTLNVLGNIPFDWPSRNRSTSEPEDIFLRCFLWFCGGCVLAGVSLLTSLDTPSFQFQLYALQISRLPLLLPRFFPGPLLAGARRITQRNHFWQAFWFTLGLTIIRFAYAARA
jgi:hypothetical protein